ncbi:facilitated trehalose transporter Tret1-like [Cylas formicarius]|uniref:facilitated trehalose transporter Tret1-like n=1 Tax=Cylas formicarius TaxID=197179 RepID=UPI0029587FD0|nr:facilitated trehalose transporter Tret1-like [Cylas formicarius]
MVAQNTDFEETVPIADQGNAEGGTVYRPTSVDQRFRDFECLQPETLKKDSDPFFLYFTTVLASLTSFGAGISLSWTSPVFPKLQSAESPFGAPIDTLQKSWIISLLSVGQVIGPFIFGYFSDKIGRKKTMILIAFPLLVGFVILAFATDVRLYYVARILHGLGLAGCMTVIAMYIAEITQQHNRGKFSCISVLLVSSGVLFPYLVGPFLSIKMFCLVSIIPLVVFLVLFPIFVPESPVYLVKSGDLDAAGWALAKLRNRNVSSIEKDLLEIREFVSANSDEKQGIRNLFQSKVLRRALLLGLGISAIPQLTGISVVVGVLHNIFGATENIISAKYASIIVGTIKVLAIFVTSAIIERLGRRFLLLFSAIGISIVLSILGLYFFLQSRNPELVQNLWFLPLVCMVLYFVCFNLGMGPVSMTVLNEIFPSNVRSAATAFVTTVSFVVAFILGFLFPIVTDCLGLGVVFWVFGGFCVISLTFIYFVVPETRGKTLAQIQEMLSD